MKKKHTVRKAHRHVSQPKFHTTEHYLVAVQGWMLVVAFALMLGVGAMVGQFVNTQMSAATPTVAGVTTGN